MPIGGRQNNSTPSSGGGLRPYAGRQGHRPVGAVLELDGHKNHLAVAEIFQIVNLELVFAVALVPRLAWLIGIFDSCAVMHMLASTAAGHRGPEIVEHVAVKSNALAGSETDDPNARTFILRQ